jgi:simple sugar transport system permease protein
MKTITSKYFGWGFALVLAAGLTSAAIAIPMIDHAPPMLTLTIMALAGALTGGIWIGLAGLLRHARGVNETISSLLLTYIGIAVMNFFVEGALRDLTNPNKPSTKDSIELFDICTMSFSFLI